MNKKRKVLTFILVIEAIIIIVIAAFLVICMNSNTAKIKKQMELAQNYLLAEEYLRQEVNPLLMTDIFRINHLTYFVGQ